MSDTGRGSVFCLKSISTLLILVTGQAVLVKREKYQAGRVHYAAASNEHAWVLREFAVLKLPSLLGEFFKT